MGGWLLEEEEDSRGGLGKETNGAEWREEGNDDNAFCGGWATQLATMMMMMMAAQQMVLSPLLVSRAAAGRWNWCSLSPIFALGRNACSCCHALVVVAAINSGTGGWLDAAQPERHSTTASRAVTKALQASEVVGGREEDGVGSRSREQSSSACRKLFATTMR